MPATIRPRPLPSPAARTAAATYTVRPGDTLSSIAARTLGDANRWRALYELNRATIGKNPAALRVGMVLKLSAPAAPAAPAVTSVPARVDSDRDGLIDRYDAAPRDRADARWNDEAAKAFAEFVPAHAKKLQEQGLEIDCADFAAKLLKDFCDAFGLPDPLKGRGAWHTYTPEKAGGLPNVQGPNMILTKIHADNLAKELTRRVNDADGDGIAGFDPATGQVDVHDLRPGDMLFYDWEADGIINHTVNVLNVAEDGSVTLAFGTYDNLAQGQPLEWKNLDLQPIQIFTVQPGSELYEKYLGAGNRLHGVHRYTWMPDHQYQAPPAPPAPPTPPPPPPTRWQKVKAFFQSWLRASLVLTASLTGR